MPADARRVSRAALAALSALIAVAGGVAPLAPAVERFVVQGQPTTTTLADGARLDERVLAFGERSVRVRIASAPGGRLRLLDQPTRFAGAFADLVGRTAAVAAIDGGYFVADFAPDGLLRVAGVELHAFDPAGPSGVLAIDERGCAIVPRGEWRAAATPRDALQAGPLLVDPGGRVGIRSSPPAAVARTAVAIGVDGAPRLVWTGPATLRDVALILADGDAIGFACDRALNCDGGPSAALSWREAGGWRCDPPTGPVRSIVLLEAAPRE